MLGEVNYRWCLIPAEHAIGNKVHAVFEGWMLVFTKPIHRSGWHSSCDLKILVREKQINQGTVPLVWQIEGDMISLLIFGKHHFKFTSGSLHFFCILERNNIKKPLNSMHASNMLNLTHIKFILQRLQLSISSTYTIKCISTIWKEQLK